VEPTVPLTVLVDDSAAVLLLRDVRGDRVRAQLGGRGLDLRLRPRGERHLEAFSSQHGGDREADPRRAPGDERGPGHGPIFASRKVPRLGRRTLARGNRKAPPLPWTAAALSAAAYFLKREYRGLPRRTRGTVVTL